VAFGGIRLITTLIANGRQNFTLHAALDWPVLGFTSAVAVLAGIIFGLAPALQATKVDVTPALKESRTQGAGPARRGLRLGHALMVTQIAVSMLLVVGAALFVRTLMNLHSIDIGFNRENLLLVNLNGQQGGYRGDALARFYMRLMDEFRQIPGVRSASASGYPLVSQYVNDEPIAIPGRTPQPGDPQADVVSVDPAFLATLQIPILAGRDFQPGDLAAPTVAVVSQKFATVFFGNSNPVGRQMSLGNGAGTTVLEIVGVARSAHYNRLQEEEQAVVYVPYTRHVAGLGRLFFTLRTAGPPTAVVSAVRRIVHNASPDVSIAEVSTQEQRIEQTIATERTFANLGACFAVLALVIACVGLYGAMAYAVARRTGEIGIRMALGAQRGGVIWMVLREVFLLAGAGILIGYGGARFAGKLVASFLYGLKPTDTLATVAAAVALLLAAVIAGYAPAWRASRIDPASALRQE
jgi:predicted permease